MKVRKIIEEYESFLKEASSILDAREVAVLKGRFSLRPKTLKETGRKHGISISRVRQIESKALRRLRRVYSEREMQKLFRPYLLLDMDYSLDNKRQTE